ncbi:delta9 fatty acid desaturase [Coccidioides immitis RS]|uniref:Delta9 fatty acid desaturase n=4 Tax=Coccidioides immitis TaxID=5501 RepID=A0A0D8JUL4_COCIM|nr:delta9 fatty acid desaturase [Coccidioides immitis RS]KJF60616.1 delta9 fatty acid desaturase [Coccidioides immitis RS]KMP03889.1 acyl-CoA desaturase [Coccidioides immitis RMSCC 2394]KMU74869.1 acyl-CoA desaturase (Delta(9)-desaturase) [Coccidioides immitis RMSCC 3703]KMU86045.1 acyl-CoA desaturase (Delta(9)-desaturase) [Coccidioides immitis H538.4]
MPFTKFVVPTTRKIFMLKLTTITMETGDPKNCGRTGISSLKGDPIAVWQGENYGPIMFVFETMFPNGDSWVWNRATGRAVWYTRRFFGFYLSSRQPSASTLAPIGWGAKPAASHTQKFVITPDPLASSSHSTRGPHLATTSLPCLSAWARANITPINEGK